MNVPTPQERLRQIAQRCEELANQPITEAALLQLGQECIDTLLALGLDASQLFPLLEDKIDDSEA